MDRGLNPLGVLTTQAWLLETRYPGRQQVAGFFDDVLRRVQALAGVKSASAVNYPSAGVVATTVHFGIEGRPARIEALQPSANPVLSGPGAPGQRMVHDRHRWRFGPVALRKIAALNHRIPMTWK